MLLAKSYDPKKLPEFFDIQPKLDGVRCLLQSGELYTRTYNKINAPQSFIDKLIQVWGSDSIVDGELICKGQILTPEESLNDFQTVVSVVRKKIPREEGWANISFMAFDTKASWLEGDLDRYYLRRELLENRSALLKFHRTHENISGLISTDCMTTCVVPDIFYFKDINLLLNADFLLKSPSERIDLIFDAAIKVGFEGLMIRDTMSPWREDVRSWELMKVKKTHTSEGKAVAWVEGKGKYSGAIGALVLEDSLGRTFKVGTGLTDAQRKLSPFMFIGKMITYSFQETTRKGIPRHPAFVTVRDYE